MLPCVCSVIDHRGRQNVVTTSVTHSAAPPVPFYCSHHILTSSVIYFANSIKIMQKMTFNTQEIFRGKTAKNAFNILKNYKVAKMTIL